MYRRVFLMSIVLMILTLPSIANAQTDAIPVQCGTIIDGEVTAALKHEGVSYSLDLAPGDLLRTQVVPIANTFAPSVAVFDPSGKLISNKAVNPGQTYSSEVQVPATGKYLIEIIGEGYSYVGAYTLYVGCTLRDGTVINPGDNLQPSVSTQPPAVLSSSPVVFGFPGLQPVDFSSAFLFPFKLGDFNDGQMPATGAGVIGYNFTGNAGQVFDLTYLRRGGNLNLGLVILSPTNKVVFLTGMVTSDLLVSRFTLQESGQYTIGVFALNLVPPAAPEATSFQIKGILT